MIMSKAALFLFCFLSIVLHVQSSATLDFNVNTTTNDSSSSSSLPFNITIGSSISASSSDQTTSYWLSPSGLFAFGFYPLCYDCDQYKVAIWINKPSNKVVVWSLESDSKEPIYDGATIILSHDGVFMIGGKHSSTEKPLFGSVSGPASYASMEDSGNFVVYNSDLNVIWQSFSYLGDTILQGQKLKSGESLFPNTGNRYQLIMQKYGNLELIDHENERDYYYPNYVYHIFRWESKTYKEGGDIVLKLDSTGRMYLVDKDGIVIKNLTKGESERSIDTIYRATLESDGYLRLYGEKIRSDESGKSTVYCVTCKRPHRIHIFGWSYKATKVAIALLVVAVVIFSLYWCCRCCCRCHELQRELELARRPFP